MRRIMITLPNTLLREVDGLAANDRVTRSEFIRQAMNRYLQQRRRLDLQERLKRGYQEMGGLNLALAEEGLALDQESLALIGKKRSP
ncbi:MAG: CopG family ribbon-helix-helix protein [Bacillota bacterium]